MKKILFFTTIFLTLGFFITNPVFAITTYKSCAEYIALGLPYPSCEVTSGGLNNDLSLTAAAYDVDDASLAGTKVDFHWEILDLALGTFDGGVTTLDISNKVGSSSVVLHMGSTLFTAINPANLKVTATYATGSSEKLFIITNSCNRDPMLYYGIAEITESGANSWQASTAEVMETCNPDYMLYYGVGEGG